MGMSIPKITLTLQGFEHEATDADYAFNLCRSFVVTSAELFATGALLLTAFTVLEHRAAGAQQVHIVQHLYDGYPRSGDLIPC